jgi:hypothetical protein
MAGWPASPQPPTRWDTFLAWANRFQVSPDFDAFERDYKLQVAARIQEARTALVDDDPSWVEKLNHAIIAKPNNLTNWRATQPLMSWCQSRTEEGKLAFRMLWNQNEPVAHRFDQFAEVVSTSGKKILIAETSFFHMAMDPTSFPMFRSAPFDSAVDITGYPTPKEAGIKPAEMGRRYEYFLQFLDNLMKRASASGIPFRDRLDAQSAMWMVTQWGPMEDWSDLDQQAFLAYRGEVNLRKESWGQSV